MTSAVPGASVPPTEPTPSADDPGGRWSPRHRVAVITGASSGIGEATARRLARAGMIVVAVARRDDRLTQLAADAPGVHPHVADVTDTEAVDRLAGWVAERFGACHALVNNAGIGGGPFHGREDLDDALRTLDVNLGGTIRTMAAFAELLRSSAPSRVVNVGSVAGKLGVGPAAYAGSKFGIVGFTEATTFAWAADGVTVCQVNPGFIETEGFPQHQIKRTRAAGLVGRPEDVARAIHEVLVSGRVERTVPGWYRALVVARHVAAPVFRTAAGRTRRASGSRD